MSKAWSLEPINMLFYMTKKKSLVDVIIKDLEIWESLMLSERVYCNHEEPYNKEAGESETEKTTWQQKWLV